jgi:GT2 family glycosyltransferase
MEISFIIPTIGRTKELQNCVSSIENSYELFSLNKIEILIIFQRTNERNQLNLKFPELCAVYYSNEAGNARLRNYLISKSRGDILVFIDDDASVREDFLKSLNNNINTYKSNTYCGRIIDKSSNSFFSKCFSNGKVRLLGHCDYDYFRCTSIVIRKQIMENIGMFDEVFGAGGYFGGAEETDLFFRLLKEKEIIYYIPELVFCHPMANNTGAVKIFSYARSVGAMFTKQILIDKRWAVAYMYMIIKILTITFVRAVQFRLYPNSILVKNEKYKYGTVFKGTIVGIIDYLKIELRKSEI